MDSASFNMAMPLDGRLPSRWRPFKPAPLHITEGPGLSSWALVGLFAETDVFLVHGAGSVD